MSSPSSSLTFRRSQVEWALWRLSGDPDEDTTKVPATLQIRITRLLELDRNPDLGLASEVPHLRYAFLDGRPGGKGSETAYTCFNAFCLALALDLMDFGFKQSEVVFLIRHTRTGLKEQFAEIKANPPVPRQRITAKERPGCPSYRWEGHDYADCRVFMVIERIEPKEGDKGINVTKPIYCRGIASLNKELDRMNFDYRKVMVIELAEMAVRLMALLNEAPMIRRGRQPKDSPS